MPRFDRVKVLNTILDKALVPVFYHPDPAVVIEVAKACFKAGLPILELTNRGDLAFQVYAELEKYCVRSLPGMVTGVGSISDAATAALYLNGGANFVVGPGLNRAVAKACNRRKVAYIPGCASVSEISDAEEMGCEIIKLFPARELGGPEFIKAVKAPCPWTRLMPTGGVELTRVSVEAWFQSGAACLGAGSSLIPPELLAKKNYTGLTRHIQNTLHLVSRAKKQAGKCMRG